MKNKKLTLIVGAGASKEIGLPVGAELKGKIASLLDLKFDYHQQTGGDYRIKAAIEAHVRQSGAHGNINSYVKAAWRIRDAMPQAISIDNFLDNHQGDKQIEVCGKLGIVKSILDAEKRSKIYIDHSSQRNCINFHATETCWLNPFTRLLTENCRAEELEKRLSTVSFVIFNYDRCIEHYLYHALQNYYSITDSNAAELLNAVDFFHPYGSVGMLPWQSKNNVAEFGCDLPGNLLLENATQIKTFTEGTDPSSSAICGIRKSVANSENLLFLGFAFHKLNMKLLSLGNPVFNPKANKRSFATAYGLSDSDCVEIAQEICAMRGSAPEQTKLRNDLACSAIFSEYTRSISLV